MSEPITPERLVSLRQAVELFRWGRMTVQVSEVRALLDATEAADIASEAIRSLHRKRTAGSSEPYCGTCFQKPYGYAPWPCPTINALEARSV